MTNFEKMNSLLDQIESKLKNKPTLLSDNNLREENLERIFLLYKSLELSDKHNDFDSIFEYKAMNIAGIGLKAEDFAKIREGKYVQIIAIRYEANTSGKLVAKNISLGYYGKAEKLTIDKKNDIVEFVLRWRYEKTFQHSEHYQQLLSKLH
jgi:hypothetical protein